MANPPVTLPGIYTAIAEYFVTSDPKIKWRNSYDFAASAPPDAGTPVVAAIASFARAMIFSDCTLGTVKIYNWARGTQPYPTGLPIAESNLNNAGDADTQWVFGGLQTAAGNDVCLRIDKPHVGVGRPGRFFFRNFIPDSNLEAVRGDQWSLVPSTPITPVHLDNVLTASGMANYLHGAPFTDGSAMVTVQYSHKTNTVHGFNYDTDWVLVGATTNKPTRKSKK